MAGFEIARLVPRTNFFPEMEAALRRCLGSGSPGSSGPTAERRRAPVPPRGEAQPATPTLREGAPAVFHGERVTILDVKGQDARIQYADGDTEWALLSDLTPAPRS